MGKRVDWTEEEMDKLFTAVVSLAKERPNIKLLEAVRLAQLTVLTENRRRNLVTIDHVTKYLRERFITNGMLPKDWESQKRKQHRVKLGDPKDEKIAILEQTLAKKEEQLAEDASIIERLQLQVGELENQPSPLAMLENFLVSVIRRGLRPEEPPKPHGVTVKATIPQHERDRRKDPMGFAAALAGGNTKPKFAIVSSFEDIDKAKLHASLTAVADMRYIDGVNKFTSLGRFNADGGRIILWADKCPPNWEAELQNIGVSFHRHKGPQSSLVQHVKEAVAK